MSLRYPSTNSVLVISPSPSTSRRSNISFALILALRRPNSCPGWIHHIRRTDQLIEKFTFGSCSTPSTSSMVATMLVISCRLMQPLSSTSHILRGSSVKAGRWVWDLTWRTTLVSASRLCTARYQEPSEIPWSPESCCRQNQKYEKCDRRNSRRCQQEIF